MEEELQKAIEESKRTAEGNFGFGMDNINQYPPGVQQVIFLENSQLTMIGNRCRISTRLCDVSIFSSGR